MQSLKNKTLVLTWSDTLKHVYAAFKSGIGAHKRISNERVAAA